MADKKKQDNATQTAAAEPAAAEPATAGATTTAAPFVDDIMIWIDEFAARNERPRKLTHQALLDLPQVDSSLMPQLNSLIKQGVTIAAIPTTSGIGASCYLVNLATLKKPTDGET
jgi:hypothetical protein